MWEVWKSTAGTLQHFDKQLSAMEKAQDKMFACRKMVRTLWCLWRRACAVCMCLAIVIRIANAILHLNRSSYVTLLVFLMSFDVSR